MAYLKIREMRKKKKLTQKDLATKVNLSASTIGMYEQGRRSPDADTLIKIASVLDVSLNELVVLDNKNYPKNRRDFLRKIV